MDDAVHFGGLFLVRGEGEDRWALECRAWFDPAPEMVRACRLEAVFAARLLDPSIPLPVPPRCSAPTPRRDRDPTSSATLPTRHANGFLVCSTLPKRR